MPWRMTVQKVQFDAFGETLELMEPRVSASQGHASRFITRAGICAFWSLLVVIVVARAAFFNPDFATSFAQVATVIKTVFGA
jgi:hypothetical protein